MLDGLEGDALAHKHHELAAVLFARGRVPHPRTQLQKTSTGAGGGDKCTRQMREIHALRAVKEQVGAGVKMHDDG